MNELVKSLALLQEKVKATKSLHNSYANFNYRNVESIYEAAKPLLRELGLTLILSDEIVLIGDRFYIKATATLSNGKDSISTSAYARESLDKKGMDSAQITGSCSSYARKYALGGLLLLDDNKDIDSQDNASANTSANTKQVANQNKELLLVKKQIASILANYDIVSKKAILDFFKFAKTNPNDLNSLNFLIENQKSFCELIESFLLQNSQEKINGVF